jgi:hypothetical protein
MSIKLRAGGLFLMGPKLPTADILLTTYLKWAMALELSPLHDNCRRYLERTTSRDALSLGLSDECAPAIATLSASIEGREIAP